MTDSREPRIEVRPQQPYLAIHRHVTDGVPAAVDSAFPELFAWLGERGIAPSGPPFMRFREIDRDGEPLELEVAAPVDEAERGPYPGDAPVLADTLPAGRYLTLVHVGPYRSEREPDLAVARARLVGWAAERGLVYSHETDRGHAMTCCVEHFRVGPVDDPDHSKWETEFAYLIVEG
jgi:effector-binding domain-containing protein